MKKNGMAVADMEAIHSPTNRVNGVSARTDQLRRYQLIKFKDKAWTHDVQLSCSVGIAIFPNGAQREELVEQADAAMYVVKRAGGSAYAFFEATVMDAYGKLNPPETTAKMAI